MNIHNSLPNNGPATLSMYSSEYIELTFKFQVLLVNVFVDGCSLWQSIVASSGYTAV